MRFKLDENLPIDAALILRANGFEADTVCDELLCGIDDEALSIQVRAENRILVTLDLDFSNIRTYAPDDYAGIIVLRLKRQDKPTVLAYMRRIVMALQKRSPDHELWIVQHNRVRFRRGLQPAE